MVLLGRLGNVAVPLIAGASAQVTGQVVWSSIAYVYHGEHLPSQLSSDPSLTTLGAQQMLEQGDIFRARYLLDNDSFSQAQARVTSAANIRNLERNAIDNQQLDILTGSDGYLGTSAMAFLQGLYPPRNQSISKGAGGLKSAEMADGSLINFPLGGYQYPEVRTLSAADGESNWIQGHSSCPEWLSSSLQLPTEPAMRAINTNNLQFLQSIWNKLEQPSNARVNFFNAYRIYEYALYNYTHSYRPRSRLTAGEMTDLQTLASTQQRNVNGNLTAHGKTPGDKIRAISGRMLAGKVVQQMRYNKPGADATKLTLMFGTHETFVAFFALSGLVNGNSKAVFERLPGYGATMMFETFTVGSYAGSSNGGYPSESDLWVRFLYRNGTDPGAQMIEYPIFGYGNSQTHLRYDVFLRAMDGVAIPTVAEWCNVCDSLAKFCPSNSAATDGESSSAGGSGGGRSPLSPAAAGAVGASVTIGFLALVALAAALLGGFRLTRRRGGNGQQREGGGGGVGFGVGGFKGAEKREDDQDVGYGRGGNRHERAGSWELRGGGGGAPCPGVPAPTAVSPMGASFSKQSGYDDDAARKDMALDDDTISLFSARPVQPKSTL